MKLLNGSELAGYIKERQAKQVRNLRQEHHVAPRLAIVQTIDDPVIDTYVRLKRRYGEDILVDVDLHKVPQEQAEATIRTLNDDPSVHGIIVQLPLAEPSQTQTLVDMVAPAKDVDALGEHATLDPATPLAISWLLAGYNVDLDNKKIVIIGNGRLVGAPLAFRHLETHAGLQRLQALPDTADFIIPGDIDATAEITTGDGLEGVEHLLEWLIDEAANQQVDQTQH